MQWTAESTAKGVTERHFRVDDTPATLWTPEKAAAGGAPLVLLGHGGGASRSEPVVLSVARRFVRHHGLAVVAIDAPFHGERSDGETFADVRALMAKMGSREVIDQAVGEWRAVLDAVLKVDGIADRIGYWGLSMGTHLGVPVVAAEPRIRAAVLGLFGALGGAPQREAAAAVTCPVMFVVQLDDELIPSSSAIELFQLLGSKDKRLHAHPGRHSAVPVEEIEENGAFLAKHLS